MAPPRGNAKAKAKGNNQGGKAKPARSKTQRPTVTSKAQDHDPMYPQHMPFELQQLILNVFQYAEVSISPILQTGDEEFKTLLQEIKGHLFRRDFNAAFKGKEALREVYALRWSPARAIGYADILRDVILNSSVEQDLASQPEKSATAVQLQGNEIGLSESNPAETALQPQVKEPKCRITCLGGGAGAEIVALAAVCRLQGSSSSVTGDLTRASEMLPMSVTAVDMADWSSVISHLKQSINAPPPLSKYASSAARASHANSGLLPDPDQCRISFLQKDVLEMTESELRDLIFPNDNATSATSTRGIITLMFTLNELFTTSIAKTTKLLLTLTDLLPPGWRLLVVDSPVHYGVLHTNTHQQQTNKLESQEPVTAGLRLAPISGSAGSSIKESDRRRICVNQPLLETLS